MFSVNDQFIRVSYVHIQTAFAVRGAQIRPNYGQDNESTRHF